MEKEKKKFFQKFKEGKLFAFLKKSGSNILDVAGDVTGIDALNKLGGLIDDDENLSPGEKMKAKELYELELRELELILGDKANARQLQVETLKQEDKFSKRFIYFFGGISVFVGMVYVFLITFVEIPEKNLRFADTILGVVIGVIITTVFQFFFGSSKGSKDKEEILRSR